MREGNVGATAQFRFLDVAKLLCALMVIALHTSPFSDINTFMDKAIIGLCRFAVPFFFFASAYLFFLKPDPIKRLGAYIVRICKYWVFFSLMGILLLKPAFGFGLIRTFLFDGWGVCWFFHGLIVSISVICLILKLSKDHAGGTPLYIIPCLLYVAGVLMNTYFSVLPDAVKGFLEQFYYRPFVTARNGLFGGTIYAMIGYRMATGKRERRKLSSCLVCLSGSALLFFAELMISWRFTEKIHGREMFFTMPLLVISVFITLCEMENRYGNRLDPKICYYCRKISFAMYGWQLLYLTVIPGSLHSMLRFLAVSICTVLTGILLVRLSKIPKLSKIMSFMI